MPALCAGLNDQLRFQHAHQAIEEIGHLDFRCRAVRDFPLAFAGHQFTLGLELQFPQITSACFGGVPLCISPKKSSSSFFDSRRLRQERGIIWKLRGTSITTISPPGLQPILVVRSQASLAFLATRITAPRNW